MSTAYEKKWLGSVQKMNDLVRHPPKAGCLTTSAIKTSMRCGIKSSNTFARLITCWEKTHEIH